jgi:trehalose/maltose transport system permease protein
LLRAPFIIALLFRALDAIRVFDVFYVFGQRSVQSMASYANFHMFAGTSSNFALGVAASIIVFLFGIIISLILVPMMRK